MVEEAKKPVPDAESTTLQPSLIPPAPSPAELAKMGDRSSTTEVGENPILSMVRTRREEVAREKAEHRERLWGPEQPPDDSAIAQQTRARDDKGKFVKEPAGETATAATEKGTETPAVTPEDQPGEEVVEEVVEEEVAAEEGAGDADKPVVQPDDAEVGEGEPAEGEKTTWLTAQLPARQEGEEVFEIEVDSPEAVERIRQLSNMAMRGAEFHRQAANLDNERSQIELERSELVDDPGTYIADKVPADRREEIVLQMLTDPGVYEFVRDQINDWEQDPSRRDVTLANQRADLVEKRAKRAEFRRQHVELQGRANQVREKVYSLIPDTVDDQTATLFIRDAINDIATHVNGLQRQGMDAQIGPDDVERVIGGRLQMYGPIFEAASQAGTPPGGNGRASEGEASPPGGTAPGAVAEADTGEQVRKVRAKRRTLATTPAGVTGAAGAAATVAAKPAPGTRLEDAIAGAKGRIKWSK